MISLVGTRTRENSRSSAECQRELRWTIPTIAYVQWVQIKRPISFRRSLIYSCRADTHNIDKPTGTSKHCEFSY